MASEPIPPSTVFYRPLPSSTVLAYRDLLTHPVHQVRLAVLGIRPEAQQEIAPPSERRRELGMPADVEGRDATQPLAGGEGAFLPTLFPRDAVRERLATG